MSKTQDAKPAVDPTEHEYRFDAKLFASFTVRSTSRKEGRKKIEAFLNGATANFGELDGESVVESVSLDDDGVDLLEIDGQCV